MKIAVCSLMILLLVSSSSGISSTLYDCEFAAKLVRVVSKEKDMATLLIQIVRPKVAQRRFSDCGTKLGKEFEVQLNVKDKQELTAGEELQLIYLNIDSENGHRESWRFK
jgi:hypothetical protein